MHQGAPLFFFVPPGPGGCFAAVLRYTAFVPSSSPHAPAEAPTRAEALGISRHAWDLYRSSVVIDLHIESYSFYRSFGYNPTRRHGTGLNRALLFGQADLPRLCEAGIHGGTWVITANPLRPPEERASSFLSYLNELSGLLTQATTKTNIVRNVPEFEAARRRGRHGAFIGVQGANALPSDLSFLEQISSRILRVTLLHMSDSTWGCTSTPRPRFRDTGLTQQGFELVEALNTCRIGVDLAHIHPQGFWDAVGAHDNALPLMVTHTGVSGIHRHWRNLDDQQLRAIADSGGVIGIMYHALYLGDPLLAGRAHTVARHIKHALDVVGEDHVALGSDWDGLICTPRDMPTCLELPRLVQELLNLGVNESSIVKLLGQNFLRVVDALKGRP